MVESLRDSIRYCGSHGTAVPSPKERLQAPVIAALLHDCLEDTEVTKDLLEERFGPEVATLVSGVSQLSMVNQLLRRKRRTDAASEEAVHLKLSKEKELRTLILSMVDEPLVLVIKLADRLHNMRTLHFRKKPESRYRTARETMDIYAPLANRLGIWQMKWELEDLAFRFEQPDTYKRIARLLDEKRIEREGYIASAIARLQSELDEVVNWANIANDESDFGASLQLGQDLFNHSLAFAPIAAPRSRRSAHVSA